MDISYFKKINNSYMSESKQETELYKINRQINKHFADTTDYHIVERNGEPFELIIIKNTDLNSDQKKIKSRPGQPFNLGDYILWNGQMWLVVVVDPDDKSHTSGMMYICNTVLRWQNASGDIVERYCNIADYTKYSSGVWNNGTLIVGDNQYGCILPIDEETCKLKRDMRFAVDSDMVETPDIYKLSNRKANIDNYEHFNRGSTLTCILSFTEFNAETDFKVEHNGKEVWICDYKEQDSKSQIEPLEPTSNITADVIGNQEIKIGSYRTYSIELYENDNPIDISTVTYTVELEKNDVDFTQQDIWIDDTYQDIGKVRVRCRRDEDLIESSFFISVKINDETVGRLLIEITDIM